MKPARHDTLNTFSIIILIALLASSCTPRESQVDSKKMADEKNLEKFTSNNARKDAKIVTASVASSLAQIRLADLAIEKTRDQEVKNIALHIKNEHAMLLADLTAYAAMRVITIPSTEERSARMKIDELKNESAEFNKKWCDEVLSRYKDSIKNLETAATEAHDADLREWSGTTLPRLRRNLDLVSACYNRLN